MTSPKALVFGASGMIGARVASAFVKSGVETLGLGGRPREAIATAIDYTYRQAGHSAEDALQAARIDAPFDRVVWAHGVNTNDSVYAFDRATMVKTFNANVVFVAETLNGLLTDGLVSPGSRFCIVSSIWQTIARQNKLSYGVSKAALQGLVASAAVDLATDGHLINAILPGVLDTAMTRSMLSADQIARVEDATLFGRLPSIDDVAATACFFCSAANRSVTGQFLAVDLGLRNVRIL